MSQLPFIDGDNALAPQTLLRHGWFCFSNSSRRDTTTFASIMAKNGHWHNNFHFDRDQEWLQCTPNSTCTCYGVLWFLRFIVSFVVLLLIVIWGVSAVQTRSSTQPFLLRPWSRMVTIHDAHPTSPGCLLSIVVFGTCDYCGLLLFLFCFLLWFGRIRYANQVVDTTIFDSIVVWNRHDTLPTAPGCFLYLFLFGTCDSCRLLLFCSCCCVVSGVCRTSPTQQFLLWSWPRM
jgi:hypothetical protein